LIEYVLIHEVNTSPAAAAGLAEIAHRLDALVNLIPFNTVEGTGFKPPTPDEIAQFRSALDGRHVEAIQRFRRGVEIAAGCGQLRGKHAGKSPLAQPRRSRREVTRDGR
jgi:23S rRNA (adenine2503-C2)-methyltransferase